MRLFLRPKSSRVHAVVISLQASDNRAFQTALGAVFAILTLVFSSCAQGGGNPSNIQVKSSAGTMSRSHNPGSGVPSSLAAAGARESDPPPPGSGSGKPQAKPGKNPKPPTKGSGDAGNQNDDPTKPAESPAATSMWTLVLGTFTAIGHQDAANQMLANLRLIAPQVTGARVYTTPKGSMVIYGSYTSRDDPAAKADEQRLKAITYQNHPVFNRVILTHLDLRLAQGDLSPLDLLSARKAHPKVDPLYTLDVAIWLTNDDPKAADRITFAEVKKKAENYARQLRVQKFEAYFYHDDANQWSTVTVGLFDRRSIDSRSGLYSNEVTALVKRFPARLVNGEPVYQFANPREAKKEHPDMSKAKPQTPRLVLVPSM